MSDRPVVDLWFRVRGETLPALHGYALYGALCRIQPRFHGATWLGIHTIHGALVGDGTLRLPASTRLGLRLPADRIPVALEVAGSSLDVDRHRICVGVPEVHPLRAAPSLSARMVTIKGYVEPDPFEEACTRQLQAMDVEAELETGPRLVQQVGPHVVVGFALRVHRLSDPASLELQRRGLGGRRRFGCGLLRPSSVAPPGNEA